MGYTIRIALPGGTLKVKSKGRLRNRELASDVPTFRFGATYIAWHPKVREPFFERLGAR